MILTSTSRPIPFPFEAATSIVTIEGPKVMRTTSACNSISALAMKFCKRSVFSSRYNDCAGVKICCCVSRLIGLEVETALCGI